MKYFVVADVHGFYTYMKEALDKAGFDPKNPKHTLISCGDLFDRGEEAKQVLDFMMSIPKRRRIFVEGNHESNLLEIIHRNGFYDMSDVYNGTIDSIAQLAGVSQVQFDMNDAMRALSKNENLYYYLKELRDYYELDDFIFVHGWLPRTYPNKNSPNYTFENYAKASKDAWLDARWMNGFSEWADMQRMIKKHKMKPLNKTVVCGHWHTAYAHATFHNKGVDVRKANGNYNECCFDAFEDKGIIGLDACTVISHKCNVLVIEEDGSYSFYQNDAK